MSEPTREVQWVGGPKDGEWFSVAAGTDWINVPIYSPPTADMLTDAEWTITQVTAKIVPHGPVWRAYWPKDAS